MPLTITIFAIIGAITVFCLFCLTALLVAGHIMDRWQHKPYEESKHKK